MDILTSKDMVWAPVILLVQNKDILTKLDILTQLRILTPISIYPISNFHPNYPKWLIYCLQSLCRLLKYPQYPLNNLRPFQKCELSSVGLIKLQIQTANLFVFSTKSTQATSRLLLDSFSNRQNIQSLNLLSHELFPIPTSF
jgi:hypothetical protein